MKFTITLTAIIAFSTVIHAEKEDLTSAQPRKRPSHEDIAKKQSEQAKIQPVIPPIQDKTAPPLEKKRSLIQNSTLLSSDSYWTLLPRGSVIHVPKHLQGKIIPKPSGQLVDWKTFLRKNSGWIHVHSVVMTEAQGKDALKPEVIKAYKSIGKLVVATCSGGPISVAPSSLVIPEEK